MVLATLKAATLEVVGESLMRQGLLRIMRVMHRRQSMPTR